MYTYKDLIHVDKTINPDINFRSTSNQPYCLPIGTTDKSLGLFIEKSSVKMPQAADINYQEHSSDDNDSQQEGNTPGGADAGHEDDVDQDANQQEVDVPEFVPPKPAVIDTGPEALAFAI